MLRFIRPGLLDAYVVSLCVGKFCDLGTNAVQVQPSNLFVQVLGQYVDFFIVVVAVFPKLHVSEDLVRE